MDEKGEMVKDAKCDLSNEEATYQVETGRHVMVKKSGKNLNIRWESASRTDVAEVPQSRAPALRIAALSTEAAPVTEDSLRRIIREELHHI